MNFDNRHVAHPVGTVVYIRAVVDERLDKDGVQYAAVVPIGLDGKPLPRKGDQHWLLCEDNWLITSNVLLKNVTDSLRRRRYG